MRRFLDHDQLVLDRWRVRLPSGGELQGSKEPGLFSKVQLALRRHYALEIKGRWETIGDQHPLVNLDARTDCIDVFWQCPPTDLHELVTEIRTAASEAPTVEAPTADAEPAPVSPDTGTPDQSEATNRPATQADRLEDAELGRLMQRLMRYLRRLGHRRLEVGELWSQVTAGDMLSTTGTLRAAVEKVGVQHLGASFYIICPGTGTPVTQNGKMLTFERLADVPKAVMCENEAGDPLEHQTADNVWLQVRAPSDSRRFSPLKAAAGIAIIFALLTLGSLYFLERFPDHKYFIYAGYTLAVLAPLAALFRLYGRDAAEWAAGLMEKVAGMLRRPQR